MMDVFCCAFPWRLAVAQVREKNKNYTQGVIPPQAGLRKKIKIIRKG
jgi:hypothetical protein